MNDFVKPVSEQVEAKVFEIVMPAAEVGIRNWRKGDVLSAKQIIGTAAYEKATKYVSGQTLGKLFSGAVTLGDLPLVHAGKGSSPELLYMLKGW